MIDVIGNLPLLMGVPAGGAAGAEAGATSILPTLVTFGLVFLIFYFLIIRPQNKKQKDTKKMLEALSKGDRVVTIGGIHGVIQGIKDDTVTLKIDSDTKMTFSRSAISNVVEKKSGKSGSGKSQEKAQEKAQEEDSSDDAESDDTQESSS
jgi:preprotein translocase subunit YajC